MAEPITIAFRSFSGGEVSEVLDGRADQGKYQTGLRTCRNAFVRKEGPVSNRSGSEFCCPLPGFVSDYGRLIPFVFNNDQAYVLVLLDELLFIVRDGMPIFISSYNITGITAANPPVATCVAHGFANGDLVYIENVSGMTQVNGRFFSVANITANTFELNEEAAIDGTAYDAYVAGGLASKVYTVATPWAGADLREIRYKQQNDIMVFTHEDYAPQKLSRLAEASWTLADAVFEPNIAPPEGGTVTGTAGATTVRYQVTAVDTNTLEESFPGYGNSKAFAGLQKGGALPVAVTTTTNHLYQTGDRVIFRNIVNANFTFLNGVSYQITVTGAAAFSLDGTTQGGGVVSAVAPAGSVEHNRTMSAALTFPAAGTPATVSWAAVANALEYNVYREINGVFGYIGTSADLTLLDTGLSVNPFDTPPVVEAFFDDTGEFPSACGFFQQRSAWGGSIDDPEATRVSRVGAFFNMTKSNPIQADDSFSFGCSSGQVNRVKHYEELDRMCVFTQGSVFTIEGDESGTLTPTNINPRKRSGSGAGTLQPLVAVSAILYVQYQGSIVQELVPGQPGQATTTRDLTVYSPHLFEFIDIVSWTFSEIPYSIVWAVRDDGTMLGLTYLKEHEIWGWHRHDTGDGDEYVDVCAIPEGRETTNYLLVRRYMPDGSARLYVERTPTRLITDAVDGRFLDCYGEPEEDANATVGNTYALHYDDSPGVLAWYLAPTGGTSPWTEGDFSPDIGKKFLLYGPDGEQFFCLIGEVAHQFAAYVTLTTSHPEWTNDAGVPNDDDVDQTSGARPFPVTLPFSTSTWSEGSNEIDQLWHLEGREVMVIGDGVPQGPLTVTAGKVTLEAHAVIRAAGLSYNSDIETLEPDIIDGETIADKRKTVGQVVVRVERTTGLSVGLDEASLQDWNAEWNLDIRDGKLFTGKLRVPNLTRGDDTGRVFLRQSLPLPFTVCSLYPRIEIGRSG